MIKKNLNGPIILKKMNNKTKQQAQVEQQIVYNLVQIIEVFDQYSLSKHLLHILRKKQDDQDPYFWSDEKLLKKIEKYYDELNTELALPKEED
jgi:hypothetical protein